MGVRVKAWLKRIYASWATRSLAVGAAATAIDVCFLLLCVELLGFMTPVSAMVGVLFGSTFTFFMNRHFAFRDHNLELAPQALKFALATGICMVFHAALVGLLADRVHVPVVIAKIIADVCVFSVGQLLVLRYLVFPKAPAAESSPPPARASARSPRAA